jgi:undecaprenyl-diphosphatase
MKLKRCKRKILIGMGLLGAFALWTMAVCTLDVQSIGPQGSCVGFAQFNRFVHMMTGVHFGLYTLTDWLGLVPIGVCAGFGLLGLAQWIKRGRLTKVDPSLFVLGGFYVVVMGAFALFEIVVVNYRPVLIDGVLEVSYPSSTTMLVMCVMPTTAMQLHRRIKNTTLRRWVVASIWVFTAFMVIGRLMSGVHWFTDILGGILLSAGLVALYDGAVSGQNQK